MSTGLPPPPTRGEQGGFAWTDWYNKLYTLLSSTGSILWTQVNKAGSSIADLQTKNHNLLTNMQGGTTNEYYHLTAAQHASLGVGNHNSLLSIQGGSSLERYHLTQDQHTKLTSVVSKAGDPTTSDIASDTWAVYKNTTSGAVKLWANDGGTLKSVTLT